VAGLSTDAAGSSRSVVDDDPASSSDPPPPHAPSARSEAASVPASAARPHVR